MTSFNFKANLRLRYDAHVDSGSQHAQAAFIQLLLAFCSINPSVSIQCVIYENIIMDIQLIEFDIISELKMF